MRALVLGVVTTGCALVQDFDHYSGGSDSAVVDTATADTAVDTTVEDTGGIDTAVDTATSDTTTTDTGTIDTGTTDTGAIDTMVTCPVDRCGATCTVLKEDALNCGMCGKACDAGQYCKNGACTCMPGLTNCSGECVDINGHHEHCGACTTICSLESNTCRASAPLSGYICTLDMYGCPTGRTHCSMNHCFDLTTDETNCGVCGKACARDEICVGGCKKYYARTASCGVGYTDCAALPGNPTRICVEGSTCPD